MQPLGIFVNKFFSNEVRLIMINSFLIELSLIQAHTFTTTEIDCRINNHYIPLTHKFSVFNTTSCVDEVYSKNSLKFWRPLRRNALDEIAHHKNYCEIGR